MTSFTTGFLFGCLTTQILGAIMIIRYRVKIMRFLRDLVEHDES